jgi:hypothetical protein
MCVVRSVDGMHPSDLANQIKANPNGALARLSSQVRVCADVQTSHGDHDELQVRMAA